MRRGKLVKTIVLLLVLGIMAGCSAQPPASQPAPQSGSTAGGSGQGPKESISFWVFDWGPLVQFAQQRVDLFQKENPDIKVVFEHSIPPTGTGGFEDKLTSALATGSAPDVFMVFSGQGANLIDRKQLRPIDGAAAKTLGFNSVPDYVNSRLPGSFTNWSDTQGNIYGVHWELSWLGLYCNTERLRAGGVDPSTLGAKGWTWNDFASMAQQVMAKDAGFYTENGNPKRNFLTLPLFQDDGWNMQVVTMFLAQSGGSVLNKDGTSATINSPEALKAIQTIVDLNRTAKLSNAGIGARAPGEIHTEFANGQSTCDIAGPWMNPAFISDKSPVKDKYVVLPLPTIDGRKGTGMWGWAWSVNGATKHADAAWKLVKYLSGDPQGQISVAGIWPPVKGVEKGPVASKIPYADQLVSSTEGGQMVLRHLKYPQIANIMRSKLEKLIYEGGDVKQTLNQANQEIEQVLKQ